MGHAVKVAISLPAELLAEVERARAERGESRSEFMRQAVEAFLRRERERADVERYIRGYLEQPETEDELALSRQLSAEASLRDPWE